MFTVSKGLRCVVLSGLILLLPFILGGGPAFDMYKLIPTIWNGTVTVYQWYIWICLYPVLFLYHTFKDYFIEALNYYFAILVCLGVLMLNKLTLTWMYGKEEPVDNLKVMFAQVFDHHMIRENTDTHTDFSQKESHLNQAILVSSVYIVSTVCYWKLIRYIGLLQLWYINASALRVGFGGYLGLSLATLSSAGEFKGNVVQQAEGTTDSSQGDNQIQKQPLRVFALLPGTAVSKNFEDIMCLGVTSVVVYLIPTLEEWYHST